MSGKQRSGVRRVWHALPRAGPDQKRTLAVRRKRPFLAHHDDRSVTIFAEWLVQAKILSVNPLAA